MDFLDTVLTVLNVAKKGAEVYAAINPDKEGRDEGFAVRPMGSKAERQGYFNNGNEFIGSKLTVRYQELTDDGIPRFPVGVTIRNYE